MTIGPFKVFPPGVAVKLDAEQALEEQVKDLERQIAELKDPIGTLSNVEQALRDRVAAQEWRAQRKRIKDLERKVAELELKLEHSEVLRSYPPTAKEIEQNRDNRDG